MLTTLIYRSRLCKSVSSPFLERLSGKAQRFNETVGVTGILLFDGDYFLQILEGQSDAIDKVLCRVSADPHHREIVQLMRDYAPERRFGNLGMAIIDMRNRQPDVLIEEVLKQGTARYPLTYGDRVFKFIRTFVSGPRKSHLSLPDDSRQWRFESDIPSVQVTPSRPDKAACQFALQPVVETSVRQISYLEALIRSPSGGSPADYFAAIPADKLYEADLYAKNAAFALANQMDIGSAQIAVNLRPMSLVMVPGAVNILLEQIASNGLVPEQVVVEVTEDEFISRFDEFEKAIHQLRYAGISLAIDDFGAGFAGLSLLSRLQPEKLKIDRSLIENIQSDGPKQAIVKAIVDCCSALEITVVAEGVETAAEWRWLEAAGIRHFQGYLFARPLLNGLPAVAWPHKI
ncbi:diguanylate phosphodiesterase [Erwinia sorbitola]|uniref:EAL domain-containing protein n=1 Tax=Erwinia sorbitola TaxID=2681984 RepID=A0A6I6F128_9GAMM|nr:diguanylate phosphodiesterase [Erwinia sorbitola]MTD25860.1 EAL domain-containing protein [Erwinia sorbitola]QGU87590.1 EAL domain-containing protein [Erwinia sorbitola]